MRLLVNYRIKRQSPRTWGIFKRSDESLVEGGFFSMEAAKRALKVIVDDDSNAAMEGDFVGYIASISPKGGGR